MPEQFTVYLRRDKRPSEGGLEIKGFSVPGEFKTFNRAFRAARKTITAEPDWERVTVTIERKVVKDNE